MNRKPLRNIDLHTDAGRLEALYRDIEDPEALAVIAHPHPLEGGTLHNKVVFRAARGLETANIATLRFNFRGAGRSQGVHDAGEGEQRDMEAAIDWITGKHPGKKLIAGGFSFGSWVASRVACDNPGVEAIFLIGAPINKYDLRYLKTCAKPLLFLHGDQDKYGDVDKLSELVDKCPTAETVIVAGADHFFTHEIDVVEETMRDWVTRILEPPKPETSRSAPRT